MAIDLGAFSTQIIIDLAIGVGLGVFVEKIQRAMLVAGAVAFCLNIFFFAFGNPVSFNQFTVAEASAKITTIVTATVYFMVHLLFIEIGTIPSNLVASQFFRK